MKKSAHILINCIFCSCLLTWPGGVYCQTGTGQGSSFKNTTNPIDQKQILYYQTENPSTEPGVSSQKDPIDITISTQAADDFIVPQGEHWIIHEIRIPGTFNEGLVIFPIQCILSFFAHNPELNQPAEVPFYSAQAETNIDADGQLVIILDEPQILASGHHWLSVQVLLHFPTVQWYWQKQSLPTLLEEYYWRSPEPWIKASLIISDLITFDHNLSFGLFGEALIIAGVVCPEDNFVCIDNPPFPLEGATPEGGFYEGPGVNDGIFFPQETGPGTFFITYNVEDIFGDINTCNFHVHVTPQPIAHAGSDKSITAGQSVAMHDAFTDQTNASVWTTSGDGFFDNPSLPQSTYTPGILDITNGQVELCITAHPMSPCTTPAIDCMFLFIEPNEYPIIECPSSIVTDTDAGVCYATGIETGEPVITDPFGIANLFNDAPSEYPAGETIITWTAVNVIGSENTCQQSVVVRDNENPVIDALPDIRVNSEPGKCGAQVFWDAPVAQDNCLTADETSSIAPGSFFPVGVTAVTYQATDIHGNTSFEGFTVTVTDVEPPQPPPGWSGMNDIIAANDPDQCGAHIHWEFPVFTDNCGEPEIQSNHQPGNFFPVGETEVTYTATDVHGNQTTSDFRITVIDVDPPEVEPPEDITAGNDPRQCGATIVWEPPAISDNCGPGTISGTHQPGDFFPVGETEVTYTATDVHGNQTNTGFRITVIDVDPPEVEPPEDITAGNDPRQCGATIVWEPPATSDNCGPGTTTGSHQPGDFFPVGETEVIYTATDVHGNQSTTGFRITVIDVDPPEVEPPEDITAGNDPRQCGATIVWEPPATSDNCGPGTISGTHQPGDFFPVGETDVIYTATDVHGNQTTTGFRITVIDVEPPDIHPDYPPPRDITIPNDPGTCGAYVNWETHMFTDNCGNVAMISTAQPGDFFPVGETQICHTVTDPSGNESVWCFDLEIYDATAPDIKCPENLIVNYDSTSPSEPVLLTGATPDGGMYLGSGVENGYFHPDVAGIGIHDIDYVYNNPESGCVYSCSFNIEVMDVTSVYSHNEVRYTIYPNPSRGYLTINGQTEKPITIIITGMNGIHLSISTTKLPAEINLTGIPKAVYIIRLIEGDSLHYQKIIVQ